MSASASSFVSEVMWYGVYGPVLSLLPPRWRSGALGQRLGHWGTVTVISAVFEALLGVNLFVAWFKLGWPFMYVWISVYMICDGCWRAMAARFEGPRGTLALMFFDEAYRTISRELWNSRHPDMADEVMLDDKRAEWQLKIESSRENKGWETGRLLLYRERYFRLESVMRAESARPFIYFFRALPAGVPSHNVIKYPPVLPSLGPAAQK